MSVCSNRSPKTGLKIFKIIIKLVHLHLKRTDKLHYAEGHKFVYDNTTFNFVLGLQSALLACHRAFKSALLACCLALKVRFSWKLYHALFLGWGKHFTLVTQITF